MKIQLKFKPSKITMITTLIILSVFSYFGYISIQTADKEQYGNGNCMLVYVRNIIEGKSKIGNIYKFPNGQLHVEPKKEDRKIIEFEVFKKGEVNGCDFVTKSGLEPEQGWYNTFYCISSLGLTKIGVISEQVDDNGTY